METRYHSVILDQERCKGCTNCIKRCPTEAIRVRGGKALILTERCIDCGECIRTCENHAKRAVGDELPLMNRFSYRIALPAPSLFGQFRKDVEPGRILDGLLSLGFEEVAEVAESAELTTVAIREYIKDRPDLPKPQISAACPVVVRLIQMKFPSLIPNLVPVEPPYLTAARLARENAAARLNLPPESIGIFFITPCPAKITEVKMENGSMPLIDGVIPIAGIYGELKRLLATDKPQKMSMGATGIGLGWARSGGENIALKIENSLAVDGIHNVLQVLEEIELDRLTDVDYIEALACPDGCIGGALTVENRFVARVKIRNMAERCEKELPTGTVQKALDLYRGGTVLRAGSLQALSGLKLDSNLADAIRKMGQVEELIPQLPGLDCGSCGSPTCRSLAEDMVQGQAQLSDCVFILREQVNGLAEELLELAQKRPRALKDAQGKEETGQ